MMLRSQPYEPYGIHRPTMRPMHSSGRASVSSTSNARLCTLLPGIRVSDVADACRSAALGFAWSAHHGWGRSELARWLVGPYAHAAAATRPLRASGMRAAVAHRALEESEIEDLLGAAR